MIYWHVPFAIVLVKTYLLTLVTRVTFQARKTRRTLEFVKTQICSI